MRELVAFYQARLDEDAQAARDAGGDRWHIGNAVDPTRLCNVHTFPGARSVAEGCGWLPAEHIARHDPERVLREVEAGRRLITRWEQARGEVRQPVSAEHFSRATGTG